MKLVNRGAYVAANVVLWMLIALGIGGLALLVPALARELAAEFSEYRGDFVVLLTLLALPVLIGLGSLLLIQALLRRIRFDQILTPTAFGLIQWLIVGTAALSGSFVLIAIWLTVKNTLPPVILIVLASFALVSLAVSLVTSVLFGLLKKAVANSDELSEVI